MALTVQLLQREFLGLPDETEDHAPRDEVEPRVERDCIVQHSVPVPSRKDGGRDSQAPVGVMTVCIRGNVSPSTPAR